MDQTEIFRPFCATMLLTLVVWVYMYGRRLPFIFSSGLDPKQMTPLELARLSPPQVSNPSDNLKNLFELPTVFYVVVLYIYVTNQVDAAYLWAAWGFFLFRALHSAVHCTFNFIPLRFALYVISAGALWFIVLRAALAAFFTVP
ncbi:MAG TPA: MAPEG family protein [Bryobacteraceae bacterium]|nr:MAPEG family protein [Bryobacteraceae bacterium]